jgi:nuclear transport factor 2 (NTF2) superfamily protein
MVVQPGTLLRGRDEIVAFLEHEFARRLWDTVVHVCTPIDETRIVVEGRVRWTDDERVMRDEARVWGLEFREGLLLRSIPARSAVEAEALLAAG